MSSSRAAPAAVVLGTLGVAAIPVAVAASRLLVGASLLETIRVAVPVSFALGLAAVALVRRARYHLERSVSRPGERVVRFARLLAGAALFLATTGAIALGFYGLLVVRS